MVTFWCSVLEIHVILGCTLKRVCYDKASHTHTCHTRALVTLALSSRSRARHALALVTPTPLLSEWEERSGEVFHACHTHASPTHASPQWVGREERRGASSQSPTPQLQFWQRSWGGSSHAPPATTASPHALAGADRRADSHQQQQAKAHGQAGTQEQEGALRNFAAYSLVFISVNVLSLPVMSVLLLILITGINFAAFFQ